MFYKLKNKSDKLHLVILKPLSNGRNIEIPPSAEVDIKRSDIKPHELQNVLNSFKDKLEITVHNTETTPISKPLTEVEDEVDTVDDKEQVEKPVRETVAMQDEITKLLKSKNKLQLIQLCESQGLDTKGNAKELAERLVQDGWQDIVG